jgi:hypothetical protein
LLLKAVPVKLARIAAIGPNANLPDLPDLSLPKITILKLLVGSAADDIMID